MNPETQRLMKRAEEDLAVATLCFENGHNDPCLYHCQQAIEKLLKALLNVGASAYRKVHDLPGLASDLGLDLSYEQLQLLGRLTDIYIPSRYGDDLLELSGDAAENYYRRTREFFEWLRPRLK